MRSNLYVHCNALLYNLWILLPPSLPSPRLQKNKRKRKVTLFLSTTPHPLLVSLVICEILTLTTNVSPSQFYFVPLFSTLTVCWVRIWFLYNQRLKVRKLFSLLVSVSLFVPPLPHSFLFVCTYVCVSLYYFLSTMHLLLTPLADTCPTSSAYYFVSRRRVWYFCLLGYNIVYDYARWENGLFLFTLKHRRDNWKKKGKEGRRNGEKG